MKKGILVIGILIVTITFAIVELNQVSTVLESMENTIIYLHQEYELNEDNISEYYDKVSDIKEFWLDKEKWLCFLFNHRDLSVITDSINRLQVYTKNNDYDNAIAELAVLKDYSSQNCHIMGFNINNVL